MSVEETFAQSFAHACNLASNSSRKRSGAEASKATAAIMLNFDSSDASFSAISNRCCGIDLKKDISDSSQFDDAAVRYDRIRSGCADVVKWSNSIKNQSHAIVLALRRTSAAPLPQQLKLK
jgi:hypothetical protein